MTRSRMLRVSLSIAGLALLAWLPAASSGWKSAGYKWITAQGDTFASSNATEYNNAFRNDSLYDTLSVWISPRISIEGASTVWFWVRDSLPATGAARLDSLASAFIQVSSDTTNWLTLIPTAATTGVANDTAMVMAIGDLSNQTMNPARTGGMGQPVKLTPYAWVDPDGGAPVIGSDVIPFRWCRLQLRPLNSGWSTATTRQRRAIYGLRVNATVLWREHEFLYKERP
mgnify:FL=1